MHMHIMFIAMLAGMTERVIVMSLLYGILTITQMLMAQSYKMFLFSPNFLTDLSILSIFCIIENRQI